MEETESKAAKTSIVATMMKNSFSMIDIGMTEIEDENFLLVAEENEASGADSNDEGGHDQQHQSQKQAAAEIIMLKVVSSSKAKKKEVHVAQQVAAMMHQWQRHLKMESARFSDLPKSMQLTNDQRTAVYHWVLQKTKRTIDDAGIKLKRGAIVAAAEHFQLHVNSVSKIWTRA